MKKINSFPKNKEYFEGLIPFAQKIISICEDLNIEPVIYGSFAHFVHTEDKSMKVNDIDILIPKKDFPKFVKSLKKAKIGFKYYPKWGTCIIKKGKLKVEVDEVGSGYKLLNEDSFSKKNVFDKIDFYGVEVKLLTLKQLEEMYYVAYNRSIEDKKKIMERIRRLEKSLGRKIKREIVVEIVKNKNLTKLEKDIINSARIKEWGKGEKKIFEKDYEPEALWFFVKKGKKVVSLGGIRPVMVEHLGKVYKIGGICSTISLEKGKGYGKILIAFMIDYSRRTGKSILGFTKQTEFFRKAELGVKKDFIKRFVWVKSDGEKIYDDDGDGIYYEGKDKFISKVLKTKAPVYIKIKHW